MELVIILLALGMLMFIAYKGFSVIIFAPIMCIICRTFNRIQIGFSHVTLMYLWGKWLNIFKLYFPIFLLGAIFGKVVEMSGLS